MDKSMMVDRQYAPWISRSARYERLRHQRIVAQRHLNHFPISTLKGTCMNVGGFRVSSIQSSSGVVGGFELEEFRG